jgi:hypothetical protein
MKGKKSSSYKVVKCTYITPTMDVKGHILVSGRWPESLPVRFFFNILLERHLLSF